jgi:type II secretory pathway pseudopilin PulG
MNLFPSTSRRATAAFTMVEIAICLAIIGIALVGIIGVLPIGMNTQRDNREEVILNQDVAMLMPAITQGMAGVDDLTNYIYAITNYWALYDASGKLVQFKANGSGYTYNSSGGAKNPPYYSNTWLTNGANIVGLLSTPEYVADLPSSDYPAVPGIFNTSNYQVYSNHIVAYVRAQSGLASEKPPQDNQLMVNDAFTYRLLVVNAPVALATNAFDTPYNRQLWQNQRELRLTFLSPEQPNGSVGNNKLTFRETVAGQLTRYPVNGQTNYFYGSQYFGVNTNF